MKKKLLFCFLLLSTITASLKAQVALTATSGTLVGTYTTLGGAFAAINAGTHKGAIVITLSGNTTETATASLDSSGNPTTSSYTSISIRPLAATPVTISGAVAGPLVTLNGADRVTFNGLNVGLASLTISNTDVSATACTIRFINDASNNQIFNTTVKGAGSATSLGVIHFSTGLLTGNDGNNIFNCNIDGTGNAPTCLLSLGTTTTSAQENSNDTLQNCKFYDFFNSAAASPVGVLINSGNTNWYIGGNSFYQTINRSTASQGVHTAMLVAPAYTTDSHIIENNFAGGTGPSATGTMIYSATGTNVLGYTGFSIQTGGPGNIVQNNTVQNVTVNYASTLGSFGNAGIFGFIGGYDGTTTFTGNTVKNFTVSNTLGAALGGAMHFNGRVTAAGTTVKPTFTITNNTIDNINFNGGGTGAAQYYGIRLEVSSGTSLTTATTISNPYFIVSGNTITNLTSPTNGSGGAWVRGIGSVATNGTSSTCPLWPKALIQNNTINGVSCFSVLASASTNTAVGIQYAGSANATNTTDSIIIKGNTIYNINSTNTADLASSVAGIIGTNGIYGITQNRIYGLNNSSPGTATIPLVAGINIRASLGNVGASSYIANNFISLGTGNTNNTSYFGILNNFSASNGINAYYNSVYIGGTAASGANNSAALYRGSELFTGVTQVTTTMDVKDNIFINQRIGGTGSSYAIAAYTAGTWTSNYNNLVSGLSPTAYYGGSNYNFAGYQTAASSDANSKAVAVTFVATATGDLHLAGASNGDGNLRGTPIASVTTDFDNATRSATAPYMGADESATTLPLQLLTFNGQLKNNNATLSWSTSAEVNTDKFEIERSNNSSTWSSIATVAAKGAASNTYQATDANLTSGKWFYRLKMIDKNGSFTYSRIVTLDLTGKSLFVLNQNYPNPVKGSTQLSYQVSEEAKVMIVLLSNDGKQIATLINQQQSVGTYNITLDLAKYGLASGNYIYKMIALDKNNQELFQSTKTITVVQ